MKVLINIPIKSRSFFMLRSLKGAAISTKQSFGKVELINGSRPFKLYGTKNK